MPRANGPAPITLTDRERQTLERNVRRRLGAYSLTVRSRIILLAADGLSNRAIAGRLGISGVTVSLWRRRFAQKGLAGLEERPRRGRPRTIRDDQVRTVIAATLGSAPEGEAYWSTRLMARKMGMSQSAISRIWRASGLRPRSPDDGRKDEGEPTSDSQGTTLGRRRP